MVSVEVGSKHQIVTSCNTLYQFYRIDMKITKKLWRAKSGKTPNLSIIFEASINELSLFKLIEPDIYLELNKVRA